MHYVMVAFVMAAGARVGGLALNNIVSLQMVLAPLLYLLPLAAAGGALWLMSHPIREPTTPTFLENLFKAATRLMRSLPNARAWTTRTQKPLRRLPAPSREVNSP